MGKKYFTLGCCGIDCGLCPRFYTVGSSKCPGCCGEDFERRHPACSFITCCVKKNSLEVCAECKKFPCAKFEKETGATDSFVTHRRTIQNQEFIMKKGIKLFIEQQKKRINILEIMLDFYDDGRSKSFYCLATALLSLDGLIESIEKAELELEDKNIDMNDLKSKAKILKVTLNQCADLENETLKLKEYI